MQDGKRSNFSAMLSLLKTTMRGPRPPWKKSGCRHLKAEPANFAEAIDGLSSSSKV